MDIYLNQTPQSVPDHQDILSLLTFLKIDSTKGYAIAVNDTVVPKSDWNRFVLKNNDKVLLIKAAQGG